MTILFLNFSRFYWVVKSYYHDMLQSTCKYLPKNVNSRIFSSRIEIKVKQGMRG